MANITKVPNGPLIKKKGPYAGSTLRSGGTIKKAQNGDTLSVKKPMTYAEKRAAQELVKEKNRQARENILNRNAAARGMTRAEVQAQQEKDKKKPDAQLEGTRCIGKDDPGCAGSAGARERRVKREARRKNGGPIKKAQVGTYQPMNPRTKFKTRSEDGNYKLKLKGDKLVERRTLKGFFSGAPRAQGKMDLNADNVKLLKSLRSITNSNDLSSSKDKGVLKNKGTSWDSIRPKYPKSEFKFAANKNGGTVKKAQNGTSQYSDPKPLYDKIKRTKDSLDNAKIKLEQRKYKTKMNYLNGKLKNEQSMMNTKKVKKAKAGAMIKRADGSMSRRGLWDNIRANKGSGKRPTKQMLVQEKKIKAKAKK